MTKSDQRNESQRTLLGFEIGTGNRVDIPLAHTVVTGLTQASGKTTTLKALISRSGDRCAVAFITKRSEGVFHDANRVDPFFREQADWQFVESLLEATMRQRMKFERGWIMRVTRGARSLEDVYANLQVQLFGDDVHKHSKGKKGIRPASGMNADIYMQLSAYFDILLPQLRGLRMKLGASATGLQLRPGLNVMDLTEFSTEMQSLVIASTIDACYLMDGVTVIIPEAWEFLPQSRKTPVMRSAEAFVRKAAASQNFLWLDSQDISGIEKTILKQVSVWILGNQREINEVEHTLKQLPVARHAKPKPEEIMHLGRGEFFVCFDRETKKVYVCPQWLTASVAERYAKPHGASEAVDIAAEIAQQYDEAAFRPVAIPFSFPIRQPDTATNTATISPFTSGSSPASGATSSLQIAEDKNMDYKIAFEDMKGKFEDLVAWLKARGIDPPAEGTSKPAHLSQPDRIALPPLPEAVAGPGASVSDISAPEGVMVQGASMESLYQWLRSKMMQDTALLKLVAEVPEIEVTRARVTVEADTSTLRGQLAAMVAEGFFTSEVSGDAAFKDLIRRAFSTAKPNVYRELNKLAAMGFLTKEETGYKAVAAMKVRIIEN